MKIRELIQKLKQYDPELDVHIAYNYGDYWRTIVAPAVSRIEEGSVIHSAYHKMPRLTDDSDDDCDTGAPHAPKDVVILHVCKPGHD